MKRLRHPIRAIREPFGTAGLIVACVALILATTGAALAAGALTGKQKKEVEKIAKKFAGKPGAPGATGPAGANGKDGAAGAQGEKGAPGEKGATGNNGAPGTSGAPGAAGESVEVAPIDTGQTECEGRGGALVFNDEGSSEVCNGEQGQPGEKGEPWAPADTLPPGALETGTWSFAGTEAAYVATENEEVVKTGIRVPISFFLKLPANVEAAHIHYIGKEGETEDEFKANCRFNSVGSIGNPNANPGELCIWFNGLNDPVENTVFKGVQKPDFTIGEDITEEAGKSGAILYFAPPTGVATGSGTFAVRAPLVP